VKSHISTLQKRICKKYYENYRHFATGAASHSFMK
ncbi:hypothetical protein CCACVL1_01988, partial [Corchorus capsularis]